MVSKEVKVVNEQGMHMRPASLLAQKATPFDCTVEINYNGGTFDAKSVMMLMTACIKCGSEIEVVCDGPDEEAALKDVVEFIEAGMGD